MKKLLAILLALALVFSVTACSSGQTEEPQTTDEPEVTEEPAESPAEEPAAEEPSQVYACEELRITLPDTFQDSTESIDAPYTGIFESEDAALFILREEKELLESAVSSLDDYAELISYANADYNPGVMQDNNGIPYFEYDFHNPDTDQDFS